MARVAQLKPNAPTIVLIDPQYAEMGDFIYDALQDLVGHSNNVVLPIPLNAIKFYQVQPTETIEVNTTPINLELPKDDKS